MTWIRVEGSIGDSPKVRRFAAALNLSPVAAIGHLILLWGQVADHAPTGDLSAVPDELIEKWAEWVSRRGRFAKDYRSHFAPTGQINDWEYHQGALVRKRERDNARLPSHSRSNPARESGGSAAETERELEGKNAGDGRTEDGDGNETTPSGQRARAGDRLLQRLTGELGRHAIVEFLDRAPDAELRTWQGVLVGCLDGLGLVRGQKATVSELAAACTDYLQTPPEQWGVIHFRSFVDRIVARRLRASGTRGNRASDPVEAGKAWLAKNPDPAA